MKLSQILIAGLFILLLVGTVGAIRNGGLIGDSVALGTISGNFSSDLENITKFPWYNHGISGAITNKTLGEWYENTTGKTYVVAVTGINDILHGQYYSDYGITEKNNIYKMALNSSGRNQTVIFVTLLPNDPEGAITDINSWMVTNLTTLPNIRVYNATPLMDNGTFHIKSEYDSGDSVHPNAAGYLAMSSEIYYQNYELLDDPPVAFSDWTANGDSWIADNGTHKLRMWNATGSHSWLTTGNTTLVNQTLVVAGGGAGGSSAGGGGGAGGLRTATETAVSGTVTVVVGSGGTTEIFSPRSGGTNGTDSSFYTLTSTGGGWGASDATKPPASGGSGGGAVFRNNMTGAASSPVTSPIQGYKGGDSSTNAQYQGGGGGGAGGAGTNGGAGLGTGGIGISSAITGVAYTYSTGGAGYNLSTIGTNYGDGGKGTDSVNSYPGIQGVVIVVYKMGATTPTVIFTTNVTSGVNPLALYLNDTSTGSPTAYNTSWGDTGWTNQTSFPSSNITHVYSTAGSYWINEYATNAYGTANGTPLLITVYGPANSDFSAWNTAGNAPHTTYLYDTSTNKTPGAVTYYWDFGDGNTSTSEKMYYTWNKTGTYSVNHSMNNGLSTSWMNKSNYVTVGTAAIAPVASFYGGPQLGAPPLQVFFTDVSTNTPTSWGWAFGDGTTSTSQNPTKWYNSSGFYTVNLTATNTAGANMTSQSNFIMVY